MLRAKRVQAVTLKLNCNFKKSVITSFMYVEVRFPWHKKKALMIFSNQLFYRYKRETPPQQYK
jgi:hypothetical protein